MSALGPHTRVRASSSVYARPFGEEIVLLDFGRGEYFALDEVGAVAWRGLESGEALATIAHRISGIYDVSESDALADLVGLVEEMRARSLVEPSAA